MRQGVVNPHARSPYKRRAKTPWRYSPLLGEIAEARRRGDHGQAERLARDHSAAYGLRVRFSLSSISNTVDW